LPCDVLHPLGCAGGIAKAAAGDAFASIAHDFASTAASAVDWLWGQLGQATAVQLSGSGFRLDAGIVTAITAVVAVGLFTLQVTASVLRRDPGGLGRAARGLLVAFVAGGAAVGVTAAALDAVDQLSAGVVQAATGGSITQLGQALLSGPSIATATTNPAALMLLALAVLAAVVIVWVALAVRKILVVVSAVFAPLAFAGSLADITIAWTRRWIEVTAALVLSKLLLVLVFVVGLGMLVGHLGQAGTAGTQTATQVIAGVLVLALAGFAPWMALRIVHFGGDHLGQLHTLASTTTHGARSMVAAPQKVAAVASSPASLAAALPGGAKRPLPTVTAAAGTGQGKGPSAPPADRGAAPTSPPATNSTSESASPSTPAPPSAARGHEYNGDGAGSSHSTPPYRPGTTGTPTTTGSAPTQRVPTAAAPAPPSSPGFPAADAATRPAPPVDPTPRSRP